MAPPRQRRRRRPLLRPNLLVALLCALVLVVALLGGGAAAAGQEAPSRSHGRRHPEHHQGQSGHPKINRRRSRRRRRRTHLPDGAPSDTPPSTTGDRSDRRRHSRHRRHRLSRGDASRLARLPERHAYLTLPRGEHPRPPATLDDSRPHRRRRRDVDPANLIQHTVVICGIIRDKADTVPQLIRNLEGVGSLFLDYRVVLYENDSSDSTPELLREWSARNRRVYIIGEPDNSAEFSALLRHVRYIKSRNGYLKVVRRMLRTAEKRRREAAASHEVGSSRRRPPFEPDVMFVTDTDFMYDFDLGAFRAAFDRSPMDDPDAPWDAICAHAVNRNADDVGKPAASMAVATSVETIYDVVAFRDKRVNTNALGDGGKRFLLKRWATAAHFRNLLYGAGAAANNPAWPMLPVHSCFGGVGFYRVAAFMDFGNSSAAHRAADTVWREDAAARQRAALTGESRTDPAPPTAPGSLPGIACAYSCRAQKEASPGSCDCEHVAFHECMAKRRRLQRGQEDEDPQDGYRIYMHPLLHTHAPKMTIRERSKEEVAMGWESSGGNAGGGYDDDANGGYDDNNRNNDGTGEDEEWEVQISSDAFPSNGGGGGYEEAMPGQALANKYGRNKLVPGELMALGAPRAAYLAFRFFMRVLTGMSGFSLWERFEYAVNAIRAQPFQEEAYMKAGSVIMQHMGEVDTCDAEQMFVWSRGVQVAMLRRKSRKRKRKRNRDGVHGESGGAVEEEEEEEVLARSKRKECREVVVPFRTRSLARAVDDAWDLPAWHAGLRTPKLRRIVAGTWTSLTHPFLNVSLDEYSMQSTAPKDKYKRRRRKRNKKVEKDS